MHDEYLARLQKQIENDSRIMAAWLEGSFGRGNPDRYSDIDLHLLLTDGDLNSFRAGAEQWLATFQPLVLFNTMFDGKMINALNADGLRLDIWLQTAESVTVDPVRVRVLHDPDRRLHFEPAQQVAETGELLQRIREFWRCIALLPTVIGRGELLSGFIGLSVEINVLSDILMAGYGVVRDRGVKNLNAFLPLDIRLEIEQAISMHGLTPSNLAKAHLALAAVAQTHGRAVAARHHLDYPHELERSVLDYVHNELVMLHLDFAAKQDDYR